MEKKRILQIQTTPMQYDGLTKVVCSLVKSAAGTDIEMDILAAKGIALDFKSEAESLGVNIITCPDRQKSLFAYGKFLQKLLREGNYQGVHVHGNSATMAIEITIAWIMGLQIRVAHCHNTKTNHPIVHKILKGPLNAFVTVPVACGKAAGEFLYTGEFVVMPNAIDLDKFVYDLKKRKEVRAELSLEGETLIGHVGRFTYQKNHDLLIDIFYNYHKEHPKSKLLLIGEGELFDVIKNKVKNLGLSDKVIFLGNTDRVSDYYQAMDVFLLPSRYEGLSITAVEAQANGLYVIMADTVDTETDLTGNCKFISDVRNYKAWNEAISKALLRERKSPLNALRNRGYDKSNTIAFFSGFY